MLERIAQHFDKDGRPIGNGCLRKYCAFIHPIDAEWGEAPQSTFRPNPLAGRNFPPQPSAAQSGPSRHDPYDDDRDRDRERDRDRDRDDSGRRAGRSRTPPRRARTRSPVDHGRSHRRDDYAERDGRSRRDPEPDSHRRRDPSQSSIASSAGTAPPRPPPSPPPAAPPRTPTTAESSFASMASTAAPPPLSGAGASRVTALRQNSISIPVSGRLLCDCVYTYVMPFNPIHLFRYHHQLLRPPNSRACSHPRRQQPLRRCSRHSHYRDSRKACDSKSRPQPHQNRRKRRRQRYGKNG